MFGIGAQANQKFGPEFPGIAKIQEAGRLGGASGATAASGMMVPVPSSRSVGNFAKPAPTNPMIANMFKESKDAALKMRASLSPVEREMWARHYADVAARTPEGPAIKLNVERAKFLRGETDTPPGNIRDHQ